MDSKFWWRSHEAKADEFCMDLGSDCLSVLVLRLSFLVGVTSLDLENFFLRFGNFLFRVVIVYIYGLKDLL